MPVSKKVLWNWSKIGLFHFFQYLFCGKINQEHNLLPDCAFGPFTYDRYHRLLTYIVKILRQASLRSFLT